MPSLRTSNFRRLRIHRRAVAREAFNRAVDRKINLVVKAAMSGTVMMVHSGRPGLNLRERLDKSISKQIAQRDGLNG